MKALCAVVDLYVEEVKAAAPDVLYAMSTRAILERDTIVSSNCCVCVCVCRAKEGLNTNCKLNSSESSSLLLSLLLLI